MLPQIYYYQLAQMYQAAADFFAGVAPALALQYHQIAENLLTLLRTLGWAV